LSKSLLLQTQRLRAAAGGTAWLMRSGTEKNLPAKRKIGACWESEWGLFVYSNKPTLSEIKSFFWLSTMARLGLPFICRSSVTIKPTI
jgi:hypothetical protein